MDRIRDEEALTAITHGDREAYESAVERGANPNPGANQNIGNLRLDLDSGYAEAVRTKNIPMMLEILENTLAGTNMALSPMERQLLHAAYNGNLKEVAEALVGVRNPQIIDAARDIAQMSGNTAFANAMFSGAKEIRANGSLTEQQAAKIQNEAIRANNAILEERFRQHQDNEAVHTRSRRRTAA
ncbi:MAG: hypothetical protein EYC62_01565 [Alphaproteobacteria bacterium]|nr:MAG: hypothetical protein EYC62_01565 [Alphaproteobacteria bacterium]